MSEQTFASWLATRKDMILPNKIDSGQRCKRYLNLCFRDPDKCSCKRGDCTGESQNVPSENVE